MVFFMFLIAYFSP